MAPSWEIDQIANPARRPADSPRRAAMRFSRITRGALDGRPPDFPQSPKITEHSSYRGLLASSSARPDPGQRLGQAQDRQGVSFLCAGEGFPRSVPTASSTILGVGIAVCVWHTPPRNQRPREVSHERFP